MDNVHEGKRPKTLTERGKSYFEHSLAERREHIQRAWNDVDTQLAKIDTCEDIQSLKAVKASLDACVNKHALTSRDFIEFCMRTNIAESIQAADRQKMVLGERKIVIDSGMQKIASRKMELLREQQSDTSRHSTKYRTMSTRSSHRSSISADVMRTKAKAEAAKARLKFAEQEADIKKKQALLDQHQALEDAKVKREKADLTADLELLAQRREVAAAEAEVEALESSEYNSELSYPDNVLPKSTSLDHMERIREYVEDTSSRAKNEDFYDIDGPNDQDIPATCTEENPLNPNANTFITNQSITSDFTRYLLKKDLLLSRLTCFDDKPESYRSWKISFQTVMRELYVTPLEELDLLLKWTGPESRKHVVSIKTANVYDPTRGLERTWARLEERYGCPEMLESSIKYRIEHFPKLNVKDTRKLYELSDLVSEIESVKNDEKMKSLFGHYDSSTGVTPIVNKLPHSLQERWTTSAVKYIKDHNVTYPPFGHFAEFLREQSKIRNNPSFTYDAPQVKKDRNIVQQTSITVRKTETKDMQKAPISFDQATRSQKCPLHLTDHSLNNCRVFRSKSIQERMKLLKNMKICFRCCESSSHVKRDCKKVIRCKECNSDSHPSALHVNVISTNRTTPSSSMNHGGESSQQEISDTVSATCTQICGDKFPGKSCAKIILADVYSPKDLNKRLRLYVLLDDQSNRTLGNSEFFNIFGVNGDRSEYILSSCSGKVRTSGRRVSGLVIQSLYQTVKIPLPSITECNQIPDNRNEIPTRKVAECYSHLQNIAQCIPPLDQNANIMLLIGRDVIQAHHVIDHRVGPANTPYAQKLPLGWTIIGESCLGNIHLPEQFNVLKTSILGNGRGSLFEPCNNKFKLQEALDVPHTSDNSVVGIQEYESFGRNVFIKTKDDEKPGFSVDDRLFLKIMDVDFHQDKDGNWICPLPFRDPRPRLQNNYVQALKRAKMLDKSLHKDTVKKQHFVTFMEKMLQNKHAEEAPPLTEGQECWFLPIFGVYHPKKPDQVRIVFDSAATYNGISLNDVLLSGPDLTNSLLGVLIRFRTEPVAVVGDIQQMFYCFRVSENHRDYLRFLWHKDNDLDKPLVEYRMCVHVFGNTASPAIATYGLRKAVNNNALGPDVTKFVHNDFYVDDGLTSLPTVNEAVDLIKRTQEVLKLNGNIRLHKIVSNRQEVMQAFPTDDLAKDIKSLDLGKESLPVQRSLGVSWCLQSDVFLFKIADFKQPYTRRGILSTINSVFDPLGFLAPVTIEGKQLLRKLVHSTTDWDEPLPSEQYAVWDRWARSLQDLHELVIPRTLISTSFSQSKDKSVHVFSDASEEAIAAVGYLRALNNDGNMEIGFILGKGKVAPSHGHTIPRLELCAAVLAVEIAESIANHLNLPLHEFRFYTDSKVVLGYIYNQSRRFYTYVANRVERIRSSTRPQQWCYVSSQNNPADQATRSVPASEMQASKWLSGPSFLLHGDNNNEEFFEMQGVDNDKEVRPEVVNLKTYVVSSQNLGSHRFSKFSCWKKLVEAIARLKHVAQFFNCNSDCRGWHICEKSRTVDAFESSQKHVLREVQREVYNDELKSLKVGKPLGKCSSIYALSPYLDKDGLLRIGGRLENSDFPEQEIHPILVPGHHHIAILLVRHIHEKVQHQGRHITEGAIRSSGFWITRAKLLISSIIKKCIKCQKMRGVLGSQKMANLPLDRLEPGPPFTSVGIDCFGPWQVVSRRTRGGCANSKRWAVMFTCLTTRAIHIEVVEELSSSSFINALRRFLSIRGPVKLFRSDRGTNFVGSTDHLGMQAINVEDKQIKEFLYNNGASWIFNPPHASHMGGVWERMIGITRKILDSLLMNVPGSGLTHEMLITFLAEACAIVNSRPLVPLTTDPDESMPLTPSLLLTQKPQVIDGISEILDTTDMYKKQWKRVQILADMFWIRWRNQYLQTLQTRRKWLEPQRNFVPGDVVLIRDKQVARNMWPMGVVQCTYPGSDGMVRKVDVRVIRDGKQTATYSRPITELVLLIPEIVM